MSERIDRLKYSDDVPSTTREGIETDLFLTGPQEFLVYYFCKLLREDAVWGKLFGEYIDPYCRMDYPAMAFPAMRVYTLAWRRQFESWYNDGTLTIDIIWPASIMREELQQVPMTIASAMEQQLSRPDFFERMCEVVPGLNRLGSQIDVDMSKFFSYGGEGEDSDNYPFTTIKVNYRLNLQEWQDYMESDNRTVDAPFQRTLKDLKTLVGIIDGLRGTDPDNVDVSLGFQQDLTD